jgi:hypothetical protein
MPLHLKEVLATKDRLAQPSSWVTSFLLPCDNPRVGERDFGPMITQLHQLTGLISPACDRYVQYLFTGANWTVLNRHRWGLQPWRCRLATSPLPDLPNQLSPLSYNSPAGLQFNQVPTINESFEFKGPTTATWYFDHSAIYRSLLLRLDIANDLSLVKGSQW